MPALTYGLSPIEQLALSKIDLPKKVRDLAPVGKDQRVDFIVHVRGAVEVQPDYEKAPAQQIPLYATVALVLKRVPGLQREKALALFAECMREAVLADEEARKVMLGEFPELEDIEDNVRTIVGELPKTPAKGAVKANLQVDVVHNEPNEEQAA